MLVLSLVLPLSFFFFFFNDTATTEIYTLSLHDALPISTTPWSSIAMMDLRSHHRSEKTPLPSRARSSDSLTARAAALARSEEHTSELQSRLHLVCRLLLEKKKKKKYKKILLCITYNSLC